MWTGIHDNTRIQRCSVFYKLNLTRHLYALLYVNIHLHKFTASIWPIIAAESWAYVVRVQGVPGSNSARRPAILIEVCCDLQFLQTHPNLNCPFLSHSFQSITNWLSYYTALYNLCHWQGRNLNKTKKKFLPVFWRQHQFLRLIMQQCNKATSSPTLGVHIASYQWVPALFALG
jgi:hypothetical protein